MAAAASPDRSFWRGRRVLLTGHTGFKGSWMSCWLYDMGATTIGYALAPPANKTSMFEALELAGRTRHRIGDIRDLRGLRGLFREEAPEIVFHLAAQSLVRRSYSDPISTYETNVMGTANVLQAATECPSVRVVVVITSDKVYDNREWCWGYREVDKLGGLDPYSSSKAAAELVVAAWRHSYSQRVGGDAIALASARAGNVLGGGDWAVDRLVPDAVRAFHRGRALEVRHPGFTRPWQHVLEPLSGYLRMAERLWHDPELGQAYNFGPRAEDVVTVSEVIDRLSRRWGPEARWVDVREQQTDAPHECRQLALTCDRAERFLGWRPRTDLDWCLDATAQWYRVHLGGASADEMRGCTREQIRRFEEEHGGAAVSRSL